MGYVGNKALSVLLDSFKGACHIIKGISKEAHFVLVGNTDLFRKITLSESFRRKGHFLKRSKYSVYGIFKQGEHNQHYHSKARRKKNDSCLKIARKSVRRKTCGKIIRLPAAVQGIEHIKA